MAARNRTSVQVDSAFPQWGRAVEKELQGALNAMLNRSEAVAKEAETAVRKGDMNSGIHVIRPFKADRGLRGAIGDTDWKALWFEKGTKAHSNRERGVRAHTAKGTAKRKSAGLVSGVKALRFLRKGVYTNQKLFFEDIRLRIERVRTGVR